MKLAHHFTSKTKLQNLQWKNATSLTPVEFCKIASAWKVMAFVCYYNEVILAVDYLAWGKTVTGVYYAE